MKTILQISEELKVTKQAIQKRISREPLRSSIQSSISVVHGTKYIDETGETLIKEAFTGKPQAENTPVDTPVDTIDKTVEPSTDTAIDTLIAMLKNELEIKNKQIDDLIADKEFLKGQLNAAQFLHAADKMPLLISENKFNETSPAANESDKPKKSFFDKLFKR